ncbi:MAG TPA: hypothetical protein VKZ53_25915 [Candidatus Angelobacter sp.]|nr:hypothetical protein [Candidatus Angelobacter sp.]
MGKLPRYALILFASAMLLSSEARARQAVSLQIELGRGFGEFTVVNSGEAVALHSQVSVERKVNDQWESVPMTNLSLREKCGVGKTSTCHKLAAQEILHPMPWTGNFCTSQCPSSCRLDGPAPPGTYRFTVTLCDRSKTFTSPAFEKRDPQAK